MGVPSQLLLTEQGLHKFQSRKIRRTEDPRRYETVIVIPKQAFDVLMRLQEAR
jgi:hypothetical protein